MMISIFYLMVLSVFYCFFYKKKDFLTFFLVLLMLLLFSMESEIILSLKSFSFLFLFLTFYIIYNMIMSLFQYMNTHIKLFSIYFIVLFLSFILFSLFFSESYYMFYVFYEFSILPTMGIISHYGNSKFRWEATLYFFLFTMISSLFLFLFLFYMIKFGEKFNNDSKNNHFEKSECSDIFSFLILMTFLAKFPTFFFHIWLPKAHVEAPTIGSMILAGVLLKMGGFGMFFFKKFNFFSSSYLSSILSSFILWGGVLISLNCYLQSDVKILIAFSSISHMSLVILGFLWNFSSSILSSLYIMLGHGFMSSLLFYMSSMFYNWSSNRSFLSMSQNENSQSLMFYFFWIIALMISAGFPPFLNFMGEVIIFSFAILMVHLLIFFVLLFLMNMVYTITMMSHILHKKNSDYFYSSQKTSMFFSFIIIMMHFFPMFFLMNSIMFY